MSGDTLPRSLVHALRLGARTSRRRWRRSRLHAAAPDCFSLRGVTLRLDEGWATPGVREAIYDGWYEADEATIVADTLRREDRVLEIGCGIGFVATIASAIADEPVRCYEADPAMVAVARRTIERNAARATVVHAVLRNDPTADAADFYVRPDFWVSSLVPDPGATRVSVPVLDLAGEIRAHAASYLVVDIEGAETDLLRAPLPECVRRLCVECHPAVSGRDEIRALLSGLLDQDFALDLEQSRPPVLFFER